MTTEAVLLLGASGAMGTRTAAELLRHPEVTRLTLAGRDRDRLEQLAGKLSGRAAVTPAVFDVLDRDELVSHMRGHDVVTSCAGPGYELEVPCVDAALTAGTAYVSLNDDLDPATEVGAKVAGAGSLVPVVSGCGASPGLSNLLVALAAAELDDVDEIEIAVGASTRDAGGPATEMHFVTMLADATRGPRVSGGSSPHPVYLPEPVGWVETFPCPHPEELAFRTVLDGGDSIAFRVGLSEKAVMDVLRAGVAARLGSHEGVKRAWLKMSRPVQPLLERMTPGNGGWTAIRVDVHGRRGGRARTISYGVVDHLINLVSITIAEATARLLRGAGAGARTPEEMFDPKSFLAAVSARGVRFARLEPHAL